MSGTFLSDTENLDRDRVADQWSQAITSGSIDEIRARFKAHGAQGPEILWSPAEDAIVPSQLRFLHGHWHERAAGRRAPTVREIDPIEMRPALGFIVLMDVIEDGRDFHCRLFGSTVATFSGFDITGMRISEHVTSPYMVTFFMAVYRAAFLRGEPLYTVHRPPITLHTSAWHRLMLPLHDEEGRIVRFLSGNVPLRSTDETKPPRL
jgi:hypothetical protein